MILGHIGARKGSKGVPRKNFRMICGKPLIDWSLAQLHPGGRLVMTFILQENLHSALAHLRQSGIHEVDCQQLAVSTLATLGSGHYFKPHNPVFVIACQKEENHG